MAKSNFFKGVGIGAGLVAAAGMVGAGFLAAKKIKESDKRVDEIIKGVFSKKTHSCKCNHECCNCEEITCIDGDDMELESVSGIPSIADMDINEVMEEDYLESLIQENERLKAQLDATKTPKKKKSND